MDFTTAILCIGLISIIMLVIEVNYTYASQGTAYGWSANRPSVEISPLGQRIKNAYSNQVESISYTLPALAGGAIMDIDHADAHTAALIIVLGRAIFGPLYYSGVPYGRLVGFGMGTVGSIYRYIILLMSL